MLTNFLLPSWKLKVLAFGRLRLGVCCMRVIGKLKCDATSILSVYVCVYKCVYIYIYIYVYIYIYITGQDSG